MTNNRFHFGVGVSPWYEDFLSNWRKRGKKEGKEWMSKFIFLKGLMNGEYFLF